MYSNRLQPALQNLLQRVVQFFHPRSSCMMRISADVQRITLNASLCITISGGRTEQLDIIAGFLPRHWLYKWFSQFHSCGTYLVLSLQLKGSVKEPNMFHNYETEKITRKASDAAENLELYRVVQFFRLRSLCTTAHLMLFSERLPIYASCMTISGGRM